MSTADPNASSKKSGDASKPSLESRVFEWTAVVAILGILYAILSPAVEMAKQRPSGCTNHLFQIGLGIMSYHEAFGVLPPAYTVDEKGNRRHSWRALILPHMGENSLEYHLDEPWDSLHNRALGRTTPETFACRSNLGAHAGETDYVMVVGPGTASPGSTSMSFTDFVDGVENTILVVEYTHSGINWLEPRDITAAELEKELQSRSHGCRRVRRAFHVWTPDGFPKRMAYDVPPEKLRALLTPTGGEAVSFSEHP